jgi:hypothetical protein
MVRFHGRDPEAWVKKTVQERFRYRYKHEELQEWVPRIEPPSATATPSPSKSTCSATPDGEPRPEQTLPTS